MHTQSFLTLEFIHHLKTSNNIHTQQTASIFGAEDIAHFIPEYGDNVPP